MGTPTKDHTKYLEQVRQEVLEKEVRGGLYKTAYESTRLDVLLVT